jgi:RNAse (barnase) inhibitor barstar
MRTLQGLFDETAAALQFPTYFGEDWDGLNDCLNDLDWLPVGPCTLLMLDTQHLLDRAEPGDRTALAEILMATAKAWNGARPFHVILHRAEGTNLPPLARELRSLGAELDAPSWLS